MQPSRPERSTRNPVTIYAKSAYQYPIVTRTSRVFVLLLSTRPGPWSRLLDLLGRVRHFDDCRAVEGFHKSRTTRMGVDHTNLKHLFSVQNRRKAGLVGDPDVHSVREFYYLDHSLRRHSKKLRKGSRVWNWSSFAAVYFLSDSGFW